MPNLASNRRLIAENAGDKDRFAPRRFFICIRANAKFVSRFIRILALSCYLLEINIASQREREDRRERTR